MVAAAAVKMGEDGEAASGGITSPLMPAKNAPTTVVSQARLRVRACNRLNAANAASTSAL